MTADPAPAPPRAAARSTRRTDAYWLIGALLAIVVVTVVLGLVNSRMYYLEDTEKGAFGVWYKMGVELRGGHLQLFNPHVWMAGNYVAEGQWGFWNPIILLISLGASLTSDAVLFTSIVKVLFLLVGAAGVFAVARDVGVRPQWSAVGAVGASLSGIMVFEDLTSWVTALFVWAFLPWVWLGARRVVHRGANPALAVVAIYLDVTIGYVYGAIGAFFVLLALAVEQLAARRWRSLLPLAVLGAVTALLCITVYLPGIVTAPVTVRNSGIVNDRFLSVSLTSLALGPQPTARPPLPGWWGEFSPVPLTYIAWFLPVIGLVDWRRARARLASMIDALVILALFSLLVLGPTQINALRFPARNLDSFELPLFILFVALLDGARARRTRARLGVVAGLTLGSAYLAWAQAPETLHRVAFFTVVILLGCWVVWRLDPADSAHRTGARVRGPRLLATRPLDAGAAALIVLTVAVVGLQSHWYAPGPGGPLGEPASTAAYRVAGEAMTDDAIVVGTVDTDPRLYHDLLIGNSWYMSGKSVQNVYTPVGYAAYAPVVCMDHLGNTCPELATRLFQPRPDTGLLLVDELSLNTVRLIKSSVPVQDRATPPAGWHVAADDDLTTTWVRDVPVPTAGAPVQTSSGVRLSGVQVTDTTVRFRVESVPASGGTVLFSRLDWPGYSVSGGGARIDPKAGDGFLVRVQLDGAAQGRTLTLSFTPPHWKGAKLAWLVAVLIGVVWSLAALVHRGRRRRAASAGEGYEPDQDPAVERTVSPAVR